jgi:hypothetical protein
VLKAKKRLGKFGFDALVKGKDEAELYERPRRDGPTAQEVHHMLWLMKELRGPIILKWNVCFEHMRS